MISQAALPHKIVTDTITSLISLVQVILLEQESRTRWPPEVLSNLKQPVIVFCTAYPCHAGLVNILIKEMDEVVLGKHQEIVQDIKLKRN